jgi:hypothetical protein
MLRDDSRSAYDCSTLRRAFGHVTIAAFAETSDLVRLLVRERVMVEHPLLDNGATQSNLSIYTPIETWTCALAQQ